jgi:hypothetical protein
MLKHNQRSGGTIAVLARAEVLLGLTHLTGLR